MPRVRLIEPQRIPHYRGYRGIEQWIIRNLMIHGNCLMSFKRYFKCKEEYESLFGKKNMILKESEPGFIIVAINKQAKDKALPYVYN